MNIEPSILYLYKLVVKADKDCQQMVKDLKECQKHLDRMQKLVDKLKYETNQ